MSDISPLSELQKTEWSPSLFFLISKALLSVLQPREADHTYLTLPLACLDDFLIVPNDLLEWASSEGSLILSSTW